MKIKTAAEIEYAQRVADCTRRIASMPKHAHADMLMGTWIKNLLERFDSATKDQVVEGLSWYPGARQYCLALADALDLPLDIVAATVACNSPNNAWHLQVKFHEAILRYCMGDQDIKCCTKDRCSGKCGRAYCPGSGMHKQKIRDLLRGKITIAQAVHGPKVSQFYSSIMGDYDTVAVDVWMVRAMIGANLQPDLCKITARQYTAMEQACRVAASMRDLPVAMFQAVVWCAIKAEWDAADVTWDAPTAHPATLPAVTRSRKGSAASVATA